MDYEALLEPPAVAVRAGLIGIGAFGRSLVHQCEAVAGLELVALCDRDLARARRAATEAGHPSGGLVECESPTAAARALAAGQRVLTRDPAVLVAAPLDVVVEATGDPEAGAQSAQTALAANRHLAMVTKEADAVVGPILRARARQAGLVYTPVDGDQPSLLIGLISWARRLGLEVVAAGKSSEYDFVFDEAAGTLAWRGRTYPAPGLADLWTPDARALSASIASRANLLSAVPQRTVADLCEMAVVMNATGLLPDVPELHLPILRIPEVPCAFRPRHGGGVLRRAGVIDVFNALRRPDELSFAGGVFVVVACQDRETWRVLSEKGHVVTEDLGYAMLFNPQHLLGIEAPLSILSAALLGRGTGGRVHRPQVDLVARAERRFAAGEVLEVTDPHHHEVAGLLPLLVPAGPACPGRALPYYMAAGRTLARDLAPGEILGHDAVHAPADSALWRLRAAQDAHFFPAASRGGRELEAGHQAPG